MFSVLISSRVPSLLFKFIVFYFYKLHTKTIYMYFQNFKYCVRILCNKLADFRFAYQGVNEQESGIE